MTGFIVDDEDEAVAAVARRARGWTGARCAGASTGDSRRRPWRAAISTSTPTASPGSPMRAGFGVRPTERARWPTPPSDSVMSAGERRPPAPSTDDAPLDGSADRRSRAGGGGGRATWPDLSLKEGDTFLVADPGATSAAAPTACSRRHAGPVALAAADRRRAGLRGSASASRATTPSSPSTAPTSALPPVGGARRRAASSTSSAGAACAADACSSGCG